MKNHARICLRQILLILAAYGLSGSECLLAGDSTWIDKASVRNIEFTLDDDGLDQFDIALNKTALAAQIAKNLADANFPINKASEKAFSHTLDAKVSRIEHQDTPSGFSFSIGDSDPRGEDFQKADVITVECTLTANKNARKTVKEIMEFSANRLKTLKDKNKITDALTDYISAACYDLLEDLALDESSETQADGGVTVKRPRWMPNIRIEVQNETAPAASNAGTKMENPGNPVIPEEPRKKMIIHNQGTPVIIKFGHDRL
jgi:hypothetical protein